jgi:ankyrin repeat protein
MASLAVTEDISGKSPLLLLPNELLLEVAAHLKRFQDLNSLLRTSRFFQTLFHTLLYRRAITANDIVRNDILWSVLSEYRVASIMHLLDNGLSINHEPKYGKYLLHWLCCLGDNAERSVPLARLMLERGADIEAKDAMHSHTALQTAVYNNNRGIAALLLAHGADVTAVNEYGDTLLHAASLYGGCDMATLLLAHGADVSVANNDQGWTPLHQAAFRGHRDFATLLLAHGAAVDARSLFGDTPLHLGLRSDNTGVIPMLLAHGADVDARNNSGRTPLHVASTSFICNDRDSAKLLLEYGADVNAMDFDGRTPLHLIARGVTDSSYNLFMAELLLEKGADVNAISNNGCSPLQEAMSNSSEDRGILVAVLIAHGAEVSVLKNVDGE